MAKVVINQYEAASLTAMSPDLLKWLTSYAPKHGVDRKLPVAKKEDGQHFYDRAELLAFDAWLKKPWPRKDGKRPGIPTGIMQEIKREANGSCVVCYGHKDTCEAAHIDPVSKSDNNHPENLIWLCANHHTAFDKGLFGPKEENREFVVAAKESLRQFMRMQWRSQTNLTVKIFTILDNCDGLLKQLDAAASKEQIDRIEKQAKKVLKAIPDLAPVSEVDPRYEAYRKVSLKLGKVAKGKGRIRNRLARASRLKDEYVIAAGMVECPLCDATGRYEGDDCPVCLGDGVMEERDLSRFDPSEYEMVDCPVCDGAGIHRGEDCAACGGEREMQRRFAERIDQADYDLVDCRLCDGSGRHDGDDCPACGGEGRMDRRHSDQTDFSQYDEVDCPLCEGSGSYEHDECPECRGNLTMRRSWADQVDLASYDETDCIACGGSGSLHGEECSVCRGDRKVPRHVNDRIDRRDYDLVDCPACHNDPREGRNECRACGGNGEMQRRHADDLDIGNY